MADKVAFMILSFSPLSDHLNVSLTLMSVHVRQFWLFFFLTAVIGYCQLCVYSRVQ